MFLMLFYLGKLLFSGFSQFERDSVRRQNNLKYRDRAPLRLLVLYNKHIFISRRIRGTQWVLRHQASRKLKLSYLSLLSRYDHLMISNEQNYKYGKYCGQMTGHTVFVNGSYVVIKFHSDPNFQLRGFLLAFTAVQIGKYKD